MTPLDRGGACARRELEATRTTVALADPDVVGTDDDINPFGLEDLLDGGRDILVFAGRQPQAPLHDRHPGPEAAVHLRELQCDVAAAEDDQVGWQRVEFEDRDVGEELDIGESRDIRHHRTASDVEEDPVSMQEVLADTQRVWILETGVTAIDGA